MIRSALWLSDRLPPCLCLQLARSRRIAIQFGEIRLYIDTVSIGNRYICPFSHLFPVLSRPFPVLSHPFLILFPSFSTLRSTSLPVLSSADASGRRALLRILAAGRLRNMLED